MSSAADLQRELEARMSCRVRVAEFSDFYPMIGVTVKNKVGDRTAAARILVRPDELEAVGAIIVAEDLGLQFTQGFRDLGLNV